MEKNQFHAVLKHFYMKLWVAARIKAKLDEVHGISAPALKTIYFWINKFKPGRSCTIDEARSGRTINNSTKDITEAILMHDRRVMVREIAETVGIWIQRVRNEKLLMEKLCAWWVLQLLTVDQKHIRKEKAF